MSVYVVMCDALCVMKIGVAEKPHQRLGDLQVGCPYPLRLAASMRGGRDLEWSIHEALHHRRMSGEWFTASEDVVAYLHSLGMFDHVLAPPHRRRAPSSGDSYCARDAAKALNISPRTLEKWRQTGFGPPHYKAGVKVSYRIADVEEWKRERTASSTAESERHRPGAR